MTATRKNTHTRTNAYCTCATITVRISYKWRENIKTPAEECAIRLFCTFRFSRGYFDACAVIRNSRRYDSRAISPFLGPFAGNAFYRRNAILNRNLRPPVQSTRVAQHWTQDRITTVWWWNSRPTVAIAFHLLYVLPNNMPARYFGRGLTSEPRKQIINRTYHRHYLYIPLSKRNYNYCLTVLSRSIWN